MHHEGSVRTGNIQKLIRDPQYLLLLVSRMESDSNCLQPGASHSFARFTLPRVSRFEGLETSLESGFAASRRFSFLSSPRTEDGFELVK